jgi:type IV secretion system protein VirB3
MAADSGDRIPKDMLFVACTRPTMLWGVPAEGFVINFFACYLAFLWIAHANILSIRGVVCLLIGPVVHIAMRMLISLDHNMFRIIRLGAETRGIQIRGVSVLWAMPWRRPSRAKDVASSV